MNIEGGAQSVHASVGARAALHPGPPRSRCFRKLQLLYSYVYVYAERRTGRMTGPQTQSYWHKPVRSRASRHHLGILVARKPCTHLWEQCATCSMSRSFKGAALLETMFYVIYIYVLCTSTPRLIICPEARAHTRTCENTRAERPRGSAAAACMRGQSPSTRKAFGRPHR